MCHIFLGGIAVNEIYSSSLSHRTQTAYLVCTYMINLFCQSQCREIQREAEKTQSSALRVKTSWSGLHAETRVLSHLWGLGASCVCGPTSNPCQLTTSGVNLLVSPHPPTSQLSLRATAVRSPDAALEPTGHWDPTSIPTTFLFQTNQNIESCDTKLSRHLWGKV